MGVTSLFMQFPKHTQLNLGLYAHALLAIVLKIHFNGVTLNYHPLAILFLVFADLEDGMVLICHSLWFWWIQIGSESSHNIWINAAFVIAANITVIFAAQLVSRSKQAAEYPVVLVASMFASLLLASQAILLTESLVQLHVRTIVYYFMVWMLETASRRTTKLDPQTRRLVSIVLVLSVLAVPLWMTILVGLASLGITLVHIRDITQNSAKCSQALA